MTKSNSLTSKHVAAAIPVHKNGQILLHHRDDFNWIPHPNTWSCFGGAVEKGESIEEAMIREIKEEIDFDVLSYQHFLSHNIPNGVMHVYLIYIDKDIDELTLSEGQDFGYFDFEDCFEKNLSAPTRFAFDLLRYYQEYRKMFNLPLVEAKQNHTLLPASSALPIKSSGEILLQHRDNKSTIIDSNLWSTFGGRSENGESPEIALMRELQEELEYQPKTHASFVSFSKGIQIGHFFITDIETSIDKLVLHEGQDMGFFSISQALKLDLAPTVRIVLKMLLRYKTYCLEYNLKLL